MLTCTKCHFPKKDTEFYWMSKAKKRRRPWCKACFRLDASERQIKRHHRLKHTKEYREQHRKAIRAYYKRNVKRYTAWHVAWVKQNRDRVNRTARARYQRKKREGR